MSKIKFLMTIGFVMFALAGCSDGSESVYKEWAVPESEFPLSEPGPYDVGRQDLTIVDESRDGREIELTLWYPAGEETDALSMRDAPANKQDAPYPLILTGLGTGDGLFDQHLATHGFVMGEVGSPDEYGQWDLGNIDHPRDMLSALEELASNPPDGLDGVIDSENVGVVGYSWEGYNALALSGARIDADYYLAQCAAAEPGDPLPEAWWIDYICSLSGKWDVFAKHAGASITESEDGLWQPLADPRIKVVMPMGSEGGWLYGQRGLAAVDRPTMILAGTADDVNYYELEAAYIFEHLGTPDKVLVSFIDQTHFMTEKPEPAKRMVHFVTAFLGHYLHGREDFAAYFSEDFVSQYNDLAWGIYDN